MARPTSCAAVTLQNAHRAQFSIDFDLRQVRAKAEHRVRNSLPILIERTGRRIKRRFAGDHVSVLVEGQLAKSESVCSSRPRKPSRSLVKMNTRAIARASQLQNFTPQLASRHVRGFARHQRLPRSRSLAAIRRDGMCLRRADRSAQSARPARRRKSASRSCSIPAQYPPRPDAARSARHASIRCAPSKDWAGKCFRTHTTFPRLPRRAAAGHWPFALNSCACAAPLAISARKASRQARMPTPCAENLPGHRRRVIVESIQNAKFQPVDANLIREIVVKLLLRDRSLRHSEAAKRPRRNHVGMHRARQRPVVRNIIRTGRMHRNSSRYRWSPRRIRAGIEVRRKIERSQFAISRGTSAQPHPRRMPLRGRHDRLGPRIHHAHRPPQMPRRQPPETAAPRDRASTQTLRPLPSG